MSTVGIQECAGNIYDLFASPLENQSRILGHFCHADSLQVLFRSIFHKFINVFRVYNHCHTLLRFGDGKLGSIKTFIFLRYFVKIYYQSVCQLTDGNRHTTCTKVVTFANQSGHFRTAEQSLDLALSWCISFLNLSSTGLNGSLRMNLGRTSCTAAAVTSGSATQQNDNITRIRSLADHVFSRSCAHNSTDLHTFCHIVRMIDLFYIAGCKSDLITIRTITTGSTTHQFFLRKLSFQCLRYRNRWISSTSHTHCLIYICTS